MTEGPGPLGSALADHYRIERELGAGGMATVYLAEDLRHGRKVAIKVLRPELAAVIGAERFVREIRTIAALQHPHILGLIDSGVARVDGQQSTVDRRPSTVDLHSSSFVYYVMPFVDGESLRDRLTREKQLPIPDAVRIATEVASALDYAHRHGVIHRDIKPENILLHDGAALVADFGIALAVSSAGGSTRMTETGMSLGTPTYMSPEQAMGEREITARSDVYALGAVTYEMLTGDPPFTGSTAQAIVARVVTASPRPLTAQRHTIPPHVEAAVLSALEKLPADRFASAAEFAQALDHPGTTAASATTSPRPAGKSGRGALLIRAGLGLGLVAAAFSAGAFMKPRKAPAPTLSIGVRLPAGENVANGVGTLLAITRDGSTLLYHGEGTARSGWWLRKLNELHATPLKIADSMFDPQFSPDGRSISLLSPDGRLEVFSVDGGPPVLATDSADFNNNSTWVDADKLLFTRRGGLARVSLSTHRVDQLTVPDAGSSHGFPQVLPNGRAVVFTIMGPTRRIAVYSFRTHAVTPLLEGAFAQYAASGHLVYARADGTLLAVPFDQDRLVVTGPPVALFGETLGQGNDIPDFVVSRNGTLVYLVAERVETRLVWVGRDGRESLVDSALNVEADGVVLSPNGQSVLIEEAGQQLAMYDLLRRTIRHPVPDALRPVFASWSPDGRTILFAAEPYNAARLMSVPADGSAPPVPFLSDTSRPRYQPLVTADGRWRIFVQSDSDGLGLMAQARDNAAPHAIGAKPSFDPALSPDERWIACVSGRTLVVQSFPVADRFWSVAVGASEPRWSHSGRELFYLDADRHMVAADFRAGEGFGARHDLFDANRFRLLTVRASYAVSPDDRRLLMIKQTGGTRQMVMVVNWFNALKSRTAR